MSSHLGVSCDSCMKTNFAGRRYKCLSCDNYDLCGRCHDANAQSHAHLSSHPTQCILSKAAHELFYAGESIAQRTIVSLTCPYCGVRGFLLHTLLKHCLEKHSIMSVEKHAQQAVMCPICAIHLSHGTQPRYVSLVDHLIRVHDDGGATRLTNESLVDRVSEDMIVDPDDEDDEDEGLPLYILAERLLAKDDNLQRAHAQNDRGSIPLRSTNTHQHPLSRQVIIRGSRGAIGGSIASHPYSTVPRTATGSFYIPFDTPLESALPTDSYATILFGQDPLFDFDSPLSDVTSNTPFFLASTLPTSTATNGRITQKKYIAFLSRGASSSLTRSNLSTAQSKRSSQLQQAVLLTDPLSSDYHSWSRLFPALVSKAQPPVDADPSLYDDKQNNLAMKAADNDRQSLLAKIQRTDTDAALNRSPSRDDHAVFCQALLLSSLQASFNSE